MTTAPLAIQKLVQRFTEQSTTYKSGSYNETQVRRDFIDPFFKALGWDIDNESDYAEAYRDVIHEDMVVVNGAKKAPDYSFRVGGMRKFFVEAKKPSVPIALDPKPAFQLRRYGWSAKLPISILTDFEELAVYDCTHQPKETDTPSKARLSYYKYTDYLEKWGEIAALFSKEAVMKGSFDRFADGKKKGTATVDEAFLAEIETWRQKLASNILLNNEVTPRELNQAVQLTIDRIIFLRICEDRGIEPYEKLLKLLKGKDIYKHLVNIFKDADDRYNSGLFHFNSKEKHATAADTLTLKLKVDDATLRQVIESLYPPNPYEFSVIPADILGQVYERFLGKVIHVEGKQALIEEKPEVKKAGGVFYTPSYIVEYIVRNTVDKLLDEKTPKQVEKLKIVDPACGSGSFLIVAYQHLLDWHLDYYLRNGGIAKFKKELHQTDKGMWRLTTQVRKSILLNNIFGVDIDAQAVEVTKLSLSLKVLEGESSEAIGKNMSLFHERALPDLGNNVKCGNSLIGTDFYGNSNSAIFTEEDHYRINAFDWQIEFAEVFKNGGFDAVIGNPPWGADIDKQLAYYHHKYPQVTQEKSESFKLFIGASVILCKKGGLFSMIIPNTFLKQSRYIDARKVLLGLRTEIIIDLGERVFTGAIVPSCIFVATNSSEKNYSISYMDLSSLKDNTEKAQAIFEEDNQTLISKSDVLKDNDLSFKSIYVSEQYPQMGDVKFIEFKDAGINYQRKNVGMAEKGKSDLSDRLLYEATEAQSTDDRMYWKGKDINRYFVSPRTNQFCRTNYKTFLNANETVVLNAAYFSKTPKILIRQTADRPIAALDYKGIWFGRSVLGLSLKPNSLVSYEYVLAVLNSPFIEQCYQQITGEKGRGFAQVKLAKIKQIPFKTPDFNKPREKQLHGEITELVKNLIKLNLEVNQSSSKSFLDKQISGIQGQINKLVEELYKS